jgi:hypothetical protein
VKIKTAVADKRYRGHETWPARTRDGPHSTRLQIPNAHERSPNHPAQRAIAFHHDTARDLALDPIPAEIEMAAEKKSAEPLG